MFHINNHKAMPLKIIINSFKCIIVAILFLQTNVTINIRMQNHKVNKIIFLKLNNLQKGQTIVILSQLEPVESVNVIEILGHR